MATVGLFGCALLGTNIWMLHAATDSETYLPPAVEDIAIPDNPVPEETETLNINLTNVTVEETEIPSTALSMEEAAGIGAQYIMDIFGEDIDGMYIEFEFSDWDHMTRSMWFGVVSGVYRNSTQRNLRIRELRDEFATRSAASEYSIWIDDTYWYEIMNAYPYIHGYFYFMIDAITGERIDIWRPSATNRGWTREESDVITEYIEREWQNNWDDLFNRETDPAIIEEFSPIALDYAGRHFINSTVVDVEFNGAMISLVVDDNNAVVHLMSLAFLVTDDTGRVAGVIITQDDHMVTSISTSRNDIVPWDESSFGYWELEEYELEDGSIGVRRAPYVFREYDDETTTRRVRIADIFDMTELDS